MKLAFYKDCDRKNKKEWLIHKLTCLWTRSVYSHVELILNDEEDEKGRVLCATSSPRDGGVTVRSIKLRPEHWDIVEFDDNLFPKTIEEAKSWFEKRKGKVKYDYAGLFGFIISPIKDSSSRLFCSEAILKSLGWKEGTSRFHPGQLYYIVAPHKKAVDVEPKDET